MFIVNLALDGEAIGSRKVSYVKLDDLGTSPQHFLYYESC